VKTAANKAMQTDGRFAAAADRQIVVQAEKPDGGVPESVEKRWRSSGADIEMLPLLGDVLQAQRVKIG
jgi:hypothetical protein